jgi:hypothetical protein
MLYANLPLPDGVTLSTNEAGPVGVSPDNGNATIFAI